MKRHQRIARRGLFVAVLAVAMASASLAAAPAMAQDVAASTPVAPGRWTPERINAWYAGQPWLVGANYVPRDAINQLEMWQADSFNPEQIDEELGWAAGIGMNTMRVFLHDLAWKQDPEGFLGRVDQFLAIAQKHKIRPMIVIFDDVWDPSPRIGKQRDPRPHVHNSGWVQSPGKAILGTPSRHDELKPYVQAVLRRFAKDDRVLAWDLYNEPANMIGNSYGKNGTKEELTDKPKYTAILLEKVFSWAREVNPDQPLSAGIFWHTGGMNRPIVDAKTLEAKSASTLHPVNQIALANSDFINWHNYDHSARVAAEIRVMSAWNRPLIITEYLARDNKPAQGTNSFEGLLPMAKGFKVGMINWGLVAGKSQTQYPWDTWDKVWTRPPAIWHHDIFHPDGTAFDLAETAFIKNMTKGEH
jgi:hypothetical protein